MLDKHGALANIRDARLDLGCGSAKKSNDYLGVDLLDLENVDIVGDVFEVLAAIPDGALAEIFSAHFFEHVADLEFLMSEVARVVRSGGKIEIVVPHFSNPYFYSDVTHLHAFGLYSFAYFVSNSPFKRKVPVYGRSLPISLQKVDLVFRTDPPFYFRYALKRVLGAILNSTRAIQEFYEENLCYFVPCYEVRFHLVRQ